MLHNVNGFRDLSSFLPLPPPLFLLPLQTPTLLVACLPLSAALHFFFASSVALLSSSSASGTEKEGWMEMSQFTPPPPFRNSRKFL